MTSKISLAVKQLIVLLALAGAIIAALGKGNLLAYIGIAYYVICALAVLLNHRTTSLLLGFAVLFHALLVSYLIWAWQIAGDTPCSYCMAAAGFALLAAVAWWKTPVAILPTLLMAIIWFVWPVLLNPQAISHETSQVTVQYWLSELIEIHRGPPLGDCGCD